MCHDFYKNLKVAENINALLDDDKDVEDAVSSDDELTEGHGSQVRVVNKRAESVHVKVGSTSAAGSRGLTPRTADIVCI